ncbi:MAG: voltage-gated chloride channel family protein [Bdellovibrio sp.]|nr:voltage-gated chloride channel family protein [Bdellovibrio sp.]
MAGSASAFFLHALDLTTATRLQNPWLLYLLPSAGLFVAWLYNRYGKSVERGNNLLLEEVHNPQKVIPLRMTPLVLLGTLITHLFGGSAGREGTAVQMGGSLADQLTLLFRLSPEKRKILLMAGISAGFASVFGTPLAGTLFGLEVLAVGRLRYRALLPCFTAAIVADRVCLAWAAHHTSYNISVVPELTAWNIMLAALAGIAFGACAASFSIGIHRLTQTLKQLFKSPLLRAFSGGVAILGLTLLLQTDRYLGLGIPVIQESFLGPVPAYDFFLKMVFTLVTLSAGFKGGEVTPLFFIGATLGNALAWLLPLPTSLLAGMGFVAVFAGAANTPLACIIMALEIFGTGPGIYTAIACIMSYLFSGHRGIYHSQKIEVFKYAQKD